MELLKLLLCSGLMATINCSRFSKLPANEEVVIATAVVPSAPSPSIEFPPRIAFSGIKFWEKVIDVAPEEPYIFVNDCELSVDIFRTADARLKFGLRFTDDNVKLLNRLTPGALAAVMVQFKAKFFEKIGSDLKFCTSATEINPRVKTSLNDHHLVYFNSVMWSSSLARNRKIPHLYVPIHTLEDLSYLNQVADFKNGKTPCCIIT